MNPATSAFLVTAAYEVGVENASVTNALISGGQLAVANTLSGSGALSAISSLVPYGVLGGVHPGVALATGVLYGGINMATDVSPGGFMDNAIKGALLSAGAQVVYGMGHSTGSQPVAGSMNTVI